MNRLIKKIIIFICVICVIFVLFSSFMFFPQVLNYKFIYKKNVEIIEEIFNDIQGVEIIDIYADIDYKMIGVRLKVFDKGELEFSDFVNDFGNYPDDIYVSEINGFGFEVKGGDRYGSLNIGKNGLIINKLGLTIDSFEDILENFDTIGKFVENLKPFPELNYISDTDRTICVKKETYLDFKEHRSHLDKCIDPLLYINGCRNIDEFLNKLDWKY